LIKFIGPEKIEQTILDFRLGKRGEPVVVDNRSTPHPSCNPKSKIGKSKID
jgi:hypothetical protein